ncbi:MAG: DUF1638 domain-containing protein [Candidatus Promineifilaceae bacterium]
MQTVLVACGALAREVLALKKRHGWPVDVLAVPAQLHNTPARIVTAVQQRIAILRYQYDRIIVVYGDCGTGGELDVLLNAENVVRVSGPHCYEMYAGTAEFDAMMAENAGTYFLTDFLLRSFEALVIKGLGLDRYPELKETYFKHYTRLVYLVQEEDPALYEKAQWAADYLGLALEIRPVYYGALESRLLTLLADDGWE